MRLSIKIGDIVLLRHPTNPVSAINGKTVIVDDVIRSVFDRTDVLDVHVRFGNGNICPIYPEWIAEVFSF